MVQEPRDEDCQFIPNTMNLCQVVTHKFSLVPCLKDIAFAATSHSLPHTECPCMVRQPALCLYFVDTYVYN